MSILIYDIAKKLPELEEKIIALETILKTLESSLEKARKQNKEVAKKVGAIITDTDISP